MNKYTKEIVLNDYKLGYLSRQLSLLGRKEALNGKAKFGIFGDGKEVAQLAMAKVFKNGDFRSGYYRDQTLMMAIGHLKPENFFALLYGDTDLQNNPDNGGRLMNNHFATRSLDENGMWKNLTAQKNSSPDISPTAGQMPRLLGLAYASKIYRQNSELHSFTDFSIKGNEVAFGTIGDASTSEGYFFETLNAAGVLQVPMAISIWDDGFGISVSQKYQTTKQNISELVEGFRQTDEKAGYLIFKARGWNYPELCETYEKAISACREKHVPVIIHVSEMTQPQGHSTSGSHERYKTTERMEWEKEFDPLKKMREWIIEQKFATDEELKTLESEATQRTNEARKNAWDNYLIPIKKERDELLKIIDEQKTCLCANEGIDKVTNHKNNLKKILEPLRRDNFSTVKKLLRSVCLTCPNRKPLQLALSDWMNKNYALNRNRYSSHLHSQSSLAALKVLPAPVCFDENSTLVAGREILRDNWDALFAKYAQLVIFGEDVGKIGGVNQTFEGLQEKYGEIRITDTGIREATIMGQALGMALRGLRPVAEIQYFDYLLYALQVMSDDLATVHYRTKGGQKAPVIISTRGHRLVGIWHAGSPLSMVINSIRGIYICVPRDMTHAAGFYNTLMESDDSALVIEPLNAYRLKERRPSNIGEFKIPLGVPEIITEGTDVTVVTYGACVKIAQEAVDQLKDFGISVELIDVQTLLPFDLPQTILESIKKTGRVLFFDEDVPGGATAYMMQKVVEEQKAFYYLDSEPKTLTSQEHRPAYSADGDYFSNPNAEDVFEAVYKIMHESNPVKFPKLY